MVSQLKEVRWSAEVTVSGDEQAIYVREREGARGWYQEVDATDGKYAACDADTATALSSIWHGFSTVIRKTP